MTFRNSVAAPLALVSLLLTAGLTSARGQAATPGPTSLSGTYESTIVDWPKGKTGILTIVGTNNTGTLATGRIDTKGHFTITLPDPKNVDLILSNVSGLFLPKSDFNPPALNCVGQGTASPQNAQYLELNFLAFVEGGTGDIALKFASDTRLPYPIGQDRSELYYFSAPTTLDGRVECTNATVIYKGTFPAGWSFPAGKLTALSASEVNTIRYTADPLTKNVTWHLYRLISGIGMQLDPPTTERPGFNIPSVVLGRPADVAGVQANDLLVEIDGKDITTLPLNEVLALIRGPANTIVTLGIKRGTEPTIRRIKVGRAEFQVP